MATRKPLVLAASGMSELPTADVLSLLGQPGAFLVAFTAGAVVANGTYLLANETPFAIVLTTLRYQIGSAGGSFSVTINAAGSAVSSMTSVSVSSSTLATAPSTGTAGLTVAAGSKITAVISSVSGSPTDATLQLNFTRA